MKRHTRVSLVKSTGTACMTCMVQDDEIKRAVGKFSIKPSKLVLSRAMVTEIIDVPSQRGLKRNMVLGVLHYPVLPYHLECVSDFFQLVRVADRAILGPIRPHTGADCSGEEESRGGLVTLLQVSY